MNRASIVFLSILVSQAAYPQAPGIQWQQALGGSADEYGESVVQTSDGGYIVVGSTESNNGDVIGQHGGFDMWVVKLDADGAVEWKKAFGGSLDDYGSAIKQTSDQGFIVAGSSYSSDGDVTTNQGGPDLWVVKLDAIGALQWQKTYGGTGQDSADDILQTADGGYVVAGETTSNDGDVSGNHGFQDMWVIRLDPGGDLVWQRALGSAAGSEYANALVEAGDGGYVVAGAAGANGGDVTGYHGGPNDYWVVKLDSTGQLQWQRALGGSGFDVARDVARTSNGSLALVGIANSNDGDVTGQHGGFDVWVVVVDAGGMTIIWQKAFGGSLDDFGESLISLPSDHLLLAGGSRSNDGDMTANAGGSDVWAGRMDGTGALTWQKSIGGTDLEGANAIVLTSDGGYLLCGATYSDDGDVIGNNGAQDFWVVKLEPDDTAIEERSNGFWVSAFPNPAVDELHLRFGTARLENVQIKVYTSAGVLVYAEWDDVIPSGITKTVPTQNLAPGNYRVSVRGSSATLDRAFVKQ